MSIPKKRKVLELGQDSRLRLNVGGRVFECCVSTLRSQPGTLLGAVEPTEEELFFDRDASVFEQVVLPFYRTGVLDTTRANIHPSVVRAELDYWCIATQGSARRQKELKEKYGERVERFLVALLESEGFKDARLQYTLFLQQPRDLLDSGVMGIEDPESRKYDIPEIVGDSLGLGFLFVEFEPAEQEAMIESLVELATSKATLVEQLHPVLKAFYEEEESSAIQPQALRDAIRACIDPEIGGDMFGVRQAARVTLRELAVNWLALRGFTATFTEESVGCQREDFRSPYQAVFPIELYGSHFCAHHWCIFGECERGHPPITITRLSIKW